MKTVIIYGSTHGKTRKAVAEAAQHLAVTPDVFDVRDLPDPRSLLDYDLMLFFSPTYGDEELQEDMEDFLQRFDVDLEGRLFAICELGSYYGYDDFSFGAMRIMREHLLRHHGRELCEPLSFDSFPRVNWTHLLDWIDYLNGQINEHVGLCHASAD